MENLYEKIVNYIILKLKSGETKITRQEIAKDLNITEIVFDIVCIKTQVSKILTELSKDTISREQINKFIDNLESMRSNKIGIDFHATRERIRQIEAKALKKLNRPGSDDDPPDDAA